MDGLLDAVRRLLRDGSDAEREALRRHVEDAARSDLDPSLVAHFAPNEEMISFFKPVEQPGPDTLESFVRVPVRRRWPRRNQVIGELMARWEPADGVLATVGVFALAWTPGPRWDDTGGIHVDMGERGRFALYTSWEPDGLGWAVLAPPGVPLPRGGRREATLELEDKLVWVGSSTLVGLGDDAPGADRVEMRTAGGRPVAVHRTPAGTSEVRVGRVRGHRIAWVAYGDGPEWDVS